MATAKELEQALHQNARDWFEGQQTWDSFSANAQALWDEIEREGQAEPVLSLIRAKLPCGETVEA